MNKKKQLTEAVRKATRMTLAGDIHSATDAIQTTLKRLDLSKPDLASNVSHAANTTADGSQATRSSYRVINQKPESADTAARPVDTNIHYRSDSTVSDNRPVPSVEEHHSSASNGAFIDAIFPWHGKSLSYKLYKPANPRQPAAPLLLMLHGCTQTAHDFAVGTQMNKVAERAGMYVLYPTQSTAANPSRCWNWFEPEHQLSGQGEPAMLSALTQSIMKDHVIDNRQVFVAGMSAGGAMALILAEQYPDLFAGVGVHSGLPTGAANSMIEAMSTMKNPERTTTPSGIGKLRQSSLRQPATAKNARPVSPQPGHRTAMPLIVFHGDQDCTVHRANAQRIVDNWREDYGTKSQSSILESRTRTDVTDLGYRSHVTTYIDKAHPEEKRCEYWQLTTTGHRWAGGDEAGSHTDAQGPDVSSTLVHFLLVDSQKQV